MFYFAKSLQALGMAILALALMQGMATGDTWRELGFLGAGVTVFIIGTAIDKRREGKGD